MDPSSLPVPEKSAILVVDDEAAITRMLSYTIKKNGYLCVSAESAEEALELMAGSLFDLVITDVQMPGMNGINLLKTIKEKYNSDIVVMTGHTDEYDYENVVTAGASDFIKKPISLEELILRIKRVLRQRHLMIEREQINKILKKNIGHIKEQALKLENAHQELRYAYLDTINRLVAAMEYKDEETGDHLVRMSRYCTLIAEKMGLDNKTIELIQFASPLHDIGKIGIPDKILLKPDRLTKKEFEVVKTHTMIGAAILENAKTDVLRLSYEIALCHHEKYNGNGYPHGILRENIPVSGRIVAIADTFDALTTSRPYKDPYPFNVAVDIILSERGQHFDPDIVDVFIDNIEEIKLIRQEVGHMESATIADFIWSERDIAAGIDKTIFVKNKRKREGGR